jgi:hypothetical protein
VTYRSKGIKQMTKRLSLASAVMTGFAALLALLLLTNPAFAHHKDGHENGGKGSTSSTSDRDGDADSDSNTSYTEDNDTNDGGTKNNVADEGDNKHPSGKDRSVENGNSGNQGKSESDPDDDGRGPDRSNGGPDKPNGSGGDDLADQDGNNGCGNDDDFEDDNEGWCGGKPKDDKKEEPKVEPTTPTEPTCPTSMTAPSTDGKCEEPKPCPAPMTQGTDGKCEEPKPCPTPMVEGSADGTCGEPTTPPDDVEGTDEEACPEDETMAASEKDCEAPVVLGSIIEADTESGDDVAAAGASDEPADRPAGAALPFTGGNVVLILIVALGLLGVGFALFRTRRN